VSLTNTTLATTAGAIEVRGVSTRDASTPVFAQSVGVDIGSNVDLLGGAGSVTIAGRADDSVGGGLSNVAAVGVQINDLQITGTQTSTGRVTLAGESLGSTGAGIAVANPNAGLEIRENGNANLRTGAGVVIGASAGPGASNALDLGSGFRPRVLSGGGVNFRPLGVDTNGNIVERAATPIEVGVPSSAQGTNFLVNPAWLAPASATSGGFDAPRIVIGSSAHQGSITVQSGALANTGNTAIALQNAATGSGGITLAGPVGSATLDLSLASAGNVTQSGALTASQLTITGTPTSSVTLTDAANQIAGLSFDGVPSIDVFSSGSLRIGSATANGFDSATSQFAAATVSANRAGQRAALSSAGDLTVGASITMTGANPVLDLRAANDVIIEPFIAIGSTGGAAQMSFTGDSDASGQGRVLIEGQSASVPSDSPPRASALNPPSVTIDSAGGNITISGRAGSSAAPTAVSIRNARVAAGAGTVSIDGRSSAFGTGVRIDDTSLSGAGVTIGGTGTLAGVNLINTDVTSGAQGMDIRGTANGSAFGAGVLLDGVVDLSTGTGPLTIAGTQRDGSPGSAGLQLGSVNIRTADGAGGTITIFGEASGTSGSGGAGMVRDLQLSGLSIGGTSANAASGANVIIGGNTANGPMFGDGMSDGVLIRTTGNVNVRPLIQVGDQIRSNDSPIAIRIAAGTGGGSSAPVGFVVPNEWLVGVNGSRGIAAAGVVVGADAHRGDIAVGAATLGGAGAPPIGLGTSGSIAFEADAGNSALNLSLSAGGNVTQAGNLTAAQLAIVSGNSADVALTSAGNRIGRLSFDGLSVFSLNTLGNLTIDAGTAVRYGPGGFATTSILGSRGGVWLLLRSQDGDVVMNRSISMLAGAASQVNLVAAERFRNNNGSTIDFVGGGGGGPDLWRVWSRTWEGTSRAPMDAPNLYGCAFGGNGLCANTQTPVPTTTNLFIYADRPTLNVTANGQSLRVGTAPGPLTYTVTGLVNGDVQDEALTGALASTAAAGSPAGSYAITQGSLASPLGYNIVYTGASVNITTGSSGGGSGQAIDIDPKAFQSARSTRFFDDQRTDVYGSNSPSRPQICIGSSAIRGVVAEGTDVEPLVIEWVRVRGQPKLSGCLTVRNEESCAAF
jgi:hypothetical protein